MCIPNSFTYLMQGQGVAISWRDSVDRGVKGQPTLTAKVIPTDRHQRGVMMRREQLSDTLKGF